MVSSRDGHDRSPWARSFAVTTSRGLLGAGSLLLVGLWCILTAVIAISLYVRNTMIDAIGLPVMVALAIAYLLSLIGVYLYADRVQAYLTAWSN